MNLLSPRPAVRGAGEGARWATRRERRVLTVRRAEPGRLVLGRVRHRLVAAERGHSVLVVGPTQSRKTSGFVVPALLEWDGPVVAASVKTDLLRHTLAWRRALGEVWVYDPGAATSMPGAPWSPLSGAHTWRGARRMAAALTEVARTGATLTDGEFWYATAAKLLAPLLLAAAVSGGTMSDVVRWLDQQEVDEVVTALERADPSDAPDARRAAWATWQRDERQRSAVYTTAETVVDAYADPVVAASASRAPGGGPPVEPSALWRGRNTLYLCAPAHDQRRLRPLFATLVGQVLEAGYEHSGRTGRPLDPPMLVVLDEAANVAPVAELDTLASTAAGHGIQLVTVWQDLGQLHARYGSRANSVVNNHRVKVFLSGLADPATLEHASQLVGDAMVPTRTRSTDARGATTISESTVARRLLAPDALRRLPPGSAVVVSGHLAPLRLTLRPWQADRTLRVRAERGDGSDS